MISFLSIKDFALIDTLNADFEKGLNIITGETGAGKSIIIEAISLALGSRADTTFVRTGKEKSVIQLVLECNPVILKILHENDISTNDGSIVITREIYASGKSNCKINDMMVTVSLLNKICRKIVDIHGQYDHQSLLSPENHLALIDLYNSSEITQIKEYVKKYFKEYTSIINQLDNLKNTKEESERKKDFLMYEHQEITSASLSIGEDEDLEQKLLILQNSEKIFNSLSASYELLYSDSHAVLSNLGKISGLMRDILDYDQQLSDFGTIISDHLYQLEDLSAEIRNYKEKIHFSSHELDEIQERLETINTLKRKYGNSIKQILQYKEKIEKEIDLIDNSESTISELTEKKEELENTLIIQSQELTKIRKKTATEIEKKINKELKELNFNHSEFKVSFDTMQNSEGNTIFSSEGTDLVEFLITTNKGEPLKPLAKIASGGEISRIMLAFKKIIGDYDGISTMIFDEIDIGISGSTASVVGKKLKEISQNHQVLCITHLPQIAAMGDRNYIINKQSDNLGTLTFLKRLNQNEAIHEIARMLGGEKISDAAIKNAEDMVKQAKRTGHI